MMYYEEKMIDGVLHARYSPNDKFIALNIQAISSRYESARRCANSLRTQNAELVGACKDAKRALEITGTGEGLPLLLAEALERLGTALRSAEQQTEGDDNG